MSSSAPVEQEPGSGRLRGDAGVEGWWSRGSEVIGTFISGLSIVILLLVGLGLALLLAGYRPVVILSGSMGQTAPAGSVVVAGPVSAEAVAAGDVLVMRRPDSTAVTHRVLEIEESPAARFAITKGDANELADAAPYPLNGTELVGRWVVPGLGSLWLTVFQPKPVLWVVGLALAATALALLRQIWSSGRDEPPTGGGSSGRRTGGGQRRPTSTRRRRWALRWGALATVPLSVGFGAGTALALWQTPASVAANQFGTKPCFDPQLTSVQDGETLHTVNGTVSVPITAVDATAAFVLASVRSADNEPADSAVQVQLGAGGTSVDITRVTDAGSPPTLTVAWSVVEYGCGMSVQRGTVNGSGTNQIDVAITSVDQAASFVLVSSAPEASATDYDTDDLFIAELVSSSLLRIRTTGSTFDTGRSFAWQVVSFDDPADVAVQTASATLGSGQTSATIALGSSVDPDTTFVLASAVSASTGADIGERMIRAHLSDADNVIVDRSVGGDAVEVAIQVVELRDGSTVRHGTVDLGSSQSLAAVAVAPVDPSRATAFSTVAIPGVAAGGMTDHVADDVAGEATATFTLANSTTVSVERQATASNASFGWQLVEWAGPAWWNSGFQFRQRLDVATGSAPAPGGYSVPVTFDHAALVSSGLAGADGDDVRVVRWDGSNWTELDRVLGDDSAWNQVDTTLWFRTVDPIAADTADTYWLYFGNPAAVSPAADPENVYLLVEDFESGTLGDFSDRTSGTGWYQASPWTRRVPLTVASSAVSSDLTDYPLLVSLTSADLAANAQSDGDDIRFTAADGTTDLPHEIESFDSATGALVAWVKVPTVTAATDTTIYLYYGADDSPDRSNVRETWSDAVSAVWHLNRDPAGVAPQLDDSSIANRDGLSGGSMTTGDLVAGAVGGAVDFDGVDDLLRAKAFDPAPTGSLSLSAVVNLDAHSDGRIVTKADDATTSIFGLSVTAAGALRAELSIGGATQSVEAGTITTGGWHHVAVTWDGTTIRLYLDGVEVDTQAAAGTLSSDATMPVVIGNTPTGDRPVDGTITEVRIETEARPPAWVAASSTNLLTPSAFVGTGSVETGSWLGQGTWSYRKPLVIDHGQIPTDLTNHPLLIEFADPLVGSNALSDGADLVFTASDGVSRLDHVLESFDGPSGSVAAWVRFPLLSSSSNTGAFVYYGNSSADRQGDPKVVFGSGADLTLSGSR